MGEGEPRAARRRRPGRAIIGASDRTRPGRRNTMLGYLRHPTLSGDTVAFVCDDDLWTCGVDGGPARRLTAGRGEPGWPALSPDGAWLAYTGRDEHHAEVWLMPAVGGDARRLTWLGADTQVRGFLPDGRVLFVSDHGQPFVRNLQAFAVDPAGGLPQPLGLGQVNHLAWGPDGGRVIGRNTTDPARWKRYRGGTAGQLWVDRGGRGEFVRLDGIAGNPSCPMWIGGRIWLLSDAEGVGNLYSCLPDGSDWRRHTDHDGCYARHAWTDGRRIVYQQAADLWLFDPTTDHGRRLDIQVPGHRAQCTRRQIEAAEHLGAARLHPQGHSVALEVRGKLVSMALWEGGVRQHGAADGARLRHGQWLADGASLLVVSDASGEERVERHDDDAPVRVLDWPPGELGRVTSMRAAPRGTRVAVANHRHELRIGDLADGSLRKVDASPAGRIEDLAWSPCGVWLAYSFQTDARHRIIKLCDTRSGAVTPVTEPEFHDHAPAFDPDGAYLYFLSERTFDPVYDAVQFELSFPRAGRPYLVALRAGGRPPFEPAPRGMKDDKADSKAAESDAGGAAPAAGADVPAAVTRIDLDGLSRRVAALPVPEGRFHQLAAMAGGKLLWTLLPIAGAHGRGGHKEGPGQLQRFDLATGQAETVLEEVDQFDLAADHLSLLVRGGSDLRVIAADLEVDAIEDDTTPSRKTGWLDLERVRLAVDPRAEWRQMLREVWRLQRDHFWVADMSGVDWDAVLRRYEPLLERVATRAELSDLIWELQGELGTSHAYEMGGDHRKPPAVALGKLAADLKLIDDEAGYAIEHIVRGDAWDASADSPLGAVGAEVRDDERIVAVNGQPVSHRRPPQALLVQQAGAKVELTLASARGRRRVLVRTLADEAPARYREWVERHRAWVHQASGGRVGYFHLPDMMSAGFAEFHRYFAAECDRDGLIVDVRYNRGGHVSELLLEKLARRRLGYVMSRWSSPTPYPETAVAGPVVALTNEHAGSDGDIFSHAFKLLGLGTLVGRRTWGGVIGIWPRHTLVDGTTTTQPEYSFWFKDVGWGLENHGTEAQVEVDIAPQDAAAGRDPQLEVALATVLAAIEREGVSRPVFSARPRLAPLPLPPRSRP